MRWNSKLVASITIGLAFGLMFSCTKYQDPKTPDVDLEGRRYCNDPIAANYNHGFPGTPDNSTCVYSTDFFAGNWQFVDSVFFDDFTFVRTDTYLLSMTPMDLSMDTLRNRILVSGFCGAGQQLHITANKFGLAFTDTLLSNTDGGQVFCVATDTVSGMFSVINDSLRNQMTIQLQHAAPDGKYLHIGKAIKQ